MFKSSGLSKLSILFILIAVIVAGVWIMWSRGHESKKSNQQNDFYTISDESTGLTFNISKSFESINNKELSSLNPGFSYGFRPADNPDAYCVLSQTKLKGSGSVTGDQLRDGILTEIKKNHPDVRLDNPTTAARPVKFGEANGVLLQLSYKESGNKVTRVEILALGTTTQVIAYCQSPSSQNAKYYNDFTTFFSSIRISK